MRNTPPSHFFRKLPLAAALAAAASCAATAQTMIIDRFDHPAQWTTETQSSPATDLMVSDGRMNFISPGEGEEFAHSTWNMTTLPADQSWSMRIDAHLEVLPVTHDDQLGSLLLGVGWTGQEERAGGGLNFLRHLHTHSLAVRDDFSVDGEDLPNAFYQSGLTSPNVALRMDYDGAARSFSFWLDADGPAGGYSWVAMGSLPFGPWMDQVGMAPGETFTIHLTGYARQLAVAHGQAWVDNLRVLLPGPPGLSTRNATAPTANGATLHGTVNPNGLATRAWFEYGPTTDYGSATAAILVPDDGFSTHDVSTVIGGLLPGRTYHFRLMAANSAGSGAGANMSFETPTLPISPGELMAPRIRFVGKDVDFTIEPSCAGRRYQLQRSDTMAPGTWVDEGTEVIGDGGTLVITIPRDPEMPRRFYRLALDPGPPGFALIPVGEFRMGDQSDPLVGPYWELPVRTVDVSAFYMGKHEVTKEEWDAVRSWGLTNGYTDLPAGGGKGPGHPAHANWYAIIKWCNARSQMEGLVPCYTVGGAIYKVQNRDDVACDWNAKGYRLPTEAEWEKAARGGVVGKNFPWGTDTISHSQANYASSSEYAYDVSPTRGYHPTYATGPMPFTAPVGSFAPNGYGLYDMAGNAWEWCWDWHGSYTSGAPTDPRGPATGTDRVVRGSSWGWAADDARCAARTGYWPGFTDGNSGFRLARGHLTASQ